METTPYVEVCTNALEFICAAAPLSITSQQHRSDFNLDGGCFGTDISSKCTKWPDLVAHGLTN